MLELAGQIIGGNESGSDLSAHIVVQGRGDVQHEAINARSLGQLNVALPFVNCVGLVHISDLSNRARVSKRSQYEQAISTRTMKWANTAFAVASPARAVSAAKMAESFMTSRFADQLRSEAKRIKARAWDGGC